jgi:hypothetical protein
MMWRQVFDTQVFSFPRLALLVAFIAIALLRHPTSLADTFALVNQNTHPTRLLNRDLCNFQQARPRNLRSSTICAKPDKGDVFDLITKWWNKADLLEVQLDVTFLASWHVMAQYLVFDMNLPRRKFPVLKPSFEVTDFILLEHLFLSVMILAILSTLSGLVTRVFEEWGFDPFRLILTMLLAGPLWLTISVASHWSPVGVVKPSMSLLVTAVIVGCFMLG